MEIHYTLDDVPARVPLAIRSADQARDRTAELRSSSGAHLVELATQHVSGMGASLIDELVHYFDNDEKPSEQDPYGLALCYAQRAELEDLLRDLADLQPGLVALHEVARLFPVALEHTVLFVVGLTVVGHPGFGYVRTFRDSEGDEYHGLVVNLAYARAHLIETTGQFSIETLVSAVRHGFINHEGFLLAYDAYLDATGQTRERPAERLKHGLLSRGIAWHLTYRHAPALAQALPELQDGSVAAYIARCNALFASMRKKRAGEGGPDEWPSSWEVHEPRLAAVDVAGYYAARAIAEAHGEAGLSEAIAQGPDHFIRMYNALGKPPLKPLTR